jgi:hypothetical protein
LLIFGNIAADKQARYEGHLLVAWISTSKISGWSLYDDS